MALQSTFASPNTFLLHPENRTYVNGQRRRISNPSSTVCLALFVMAFLGFAAVFLSMMMQDMHHWWTIESSGIITGGEFVDRWVAAADSDLRHYASFRYTHEQVSYEAEQRIDQSLYEHAEAGSKVDVHYVPQNPTVAAIVGTNHFPLGITLMAIIWTTVVLIFAWREWQRFWRVRQLERNGILLEGFFTNCNISKNSDGDWLLQIEYCFMPPDSMTAISGHERVVLNEAADHARPNIGGAVQILYHDPKNYVLL